MKILVAVLVALMVVLPCSPIGAQTTETNTTVDHWPTANECLAAENAPFYVPSIRHEEKGRGVVRGLPLGSCVEMILPDRLGGRGWVRVEAGRRFVFDQNDGKVLRLAECNNIVFSLVPFKTTQLSIQQPVTQQPSATSSVLPTSYSSSVNVNIDMRGEQGQQEVWQPAYVTPRDKGHHGWLIGGVILAGGAVAGIVFATRGHGNNSSGNLNTGGAY